MNASSFVSPPQLLALARELELPSCVCEQLVQTAVPALLDACLKVRQQQGDCPTGHAVITLAGDLPAKAVVHTVGPVWRGGEQNEDQL